MGGWRTAPIVGGVRLPDDLLDETESATPDEDRVSGDPAVVAVLRPQYAEVGYDRLKFPIALLLTAYQIVFGHRQGMTANSMWRISSATTSPSSANL